MRVLWLPIALFMSNIACGSYSRALQSYCEEGVDVIAAGAPVCNCMLDVAGTRSKCAANSVNLVESDRPALEQQLRDLKASDCKFLRDRAASDPDRFLQCVGVSLDGGLVPDGG